MSDVLKNIKSKNGKYIIPVEWSVYSTITVEANNLEEAVEIAKKRADDLPLCLNPEYIDGSYRIGVDIDEDAIVAQSYQTIGNVVIKKDGSIES